MNTELFKQHFLHDEIIFMHCSLQIKQNIYSNGIFRPPVVTQFIVKVKGKHYLIAFYQRIVEL